MLYKGESDKPSRIAQLSAVGGTAPPRTEQTCCPHCIAQNASSSIGLTQCEVLMAKLPTN